MKDKSILEMVGGEKHINPHYNIKAEKMDKNEMNEEELFCKLFPEYVVNGKPLSPYFDLFESGYEQAKKIKVVEHFEAYGQCRDSRRIAELEQKLEQTEKDLADYQFNYPTIKELEAQIEKMKRHANCKHCDSKGYCEVRKKYLIDLSYNGCDEWELED